MSQGTLYIVSAPSGAGKTSLLHEVRKLTELTVAISHTTRDARPGESNGQHYHFVTKDEFSQMVKDDEFLEHAEVFGNFYGTSRQEVMKLLNQGNNVVLEIDWQGAQQVRKIFPDAVSIFVLPPTISDLESRLRARGQDNDEIIARRMDQAHSEISHYNEYDYLVINDHMDDAIQQLTYIFSEPDKYSPPKEDSMSALLSGL